MRAAKKTREGEEERIVAGRARHDYFLGLNTPRLPINLSNYKTSTKIQDTDGDIKLGDAVC